MTNASEKDTGPEAGVKGVVEGLKGQGQGSGWSRDRQG
jgi:hypothetical protein